MPGKTARSCAYLTSIRRMSMDSTVVKKNICRKKSDTRPTTAKRQNSCGQDTLISYGSCRDSGKYSTFRNREIQQTLAQSTGLSLFYWQILLLVLCNSWEIGARKVHVRTQERICSDLNSLFFWAIKHQSTIWKTSRGCFPKSQRQSSQSPAPVPKTQSQTASKGESFLRYQ